MLKPLVLLSSLSLATPFVALAQDTDKPTLPPLVELEIAPVDTNSGAPAAPVLAPVEKPANISDTYRPNITLLVGKDRIAWLDKVSAWFNGFDTLTAKFTQLGWDGSFADGELRIKRPGKFRFDYAPPIPIMMVSDGFWFVMVDKELETVNRVPMISTPLAPLTGETVDLANNPDIVVDSMKLQDHALTITFHRFEKREEGTITLHFRRKGGLQLTQWEVIDATGLPTTIVLDDLKKDLAMSNLDFVVFDEEPKSSDR